MNAVNPDGSPLDEPFRLPDFYALFSNECPEPLRTMPQLPQRNAEHMAVMQAKRRQVNVSNTPVVARLVRLLEELLERDDVRTGADTNWYWKKLNEIKAEINGADRGGESEEGRNAEGSTET